MSLRMSRRVVAFALIVVITVVAVWGASRLAPRPRVDEGRAAVLQKPEAAGPAAPFAGQPGLERPPSPLPTQPGGLHDGSLGERLSAEAARIGAGDAVAVLVAELERLDRERPITFPEDAARTLEAFVVAPAVAHVGRESIVGALESELDARVHAPRVGGALLTVLGGLGGAGRVLDRLPLADGELLRSAIAAVAWGGAEEGEATAVALRPADFLMLQPRGGLTVLDLPWNRSPTVAAESWLLGLVRNPAREFAALLQRELAVMALGTAIDERTDLLELFRTWLMDRDAIAQQLRPALVFVLAQARSAAAREVLTRFLEDPQVGDYGKLLARWWLSKQPAMVGDLEVLAAPLMDPHSTEEDRIMAAGSLLTRVADAGPSDLAQLEELLAMRVLQEQDLTARMAALAVLENIPGGFLRLGSLEQALRGDPEVLVRKVAARGLAKTKGPMRQEALAMLRAALGSASDPGLVLHIQQLLAEAELEEP